MSLRRLMSNKWIRTVIRICLLLSVVLTVILVIDKNVHVFRVATYGTVPNTQSSQQSRPPKGVLYSSPEVFQFTDRLHPPKTAHTPGELKHVAPHVARLLSSGLNSSQYGILIDLLYTFDNSMKMNNITYFLFAGSLLGSWRCHCILQWDDDIDILLNIKDKPKVLKAMKLLSPDYTSVDSVDTIIKFYKTAQSSAIPGLPWGWPFIDVSFYTEDSEYIRETNPSWKSFPFKRDDIFPLHYRPFEELDVLAPRNTKAILEQVYNIKNCATQNYNHKTERLENKVVTIKCEDLKSIHPLVRRTRVTQGMEEVLMIGEREIHRKIVDE